MKKMMAVLSVAALSVAPLGLAEDGAVAAPHEGAGGARGGRGAGGPGGQGAQMQERVKEAWAIVDKQACFKAMDTNADGNVSKEEFEKTDLQVVFGGALREALAKRGGKGAGDGADGGPAQWDKDGDGKITAAEFPRGEEVFKKLLERGDKDGDGALSIEEMKAAREAVQQRQERKAGKP